MVKGILRVAARRMHEIRKEIRFLQQRIHSLRRSETFLLRFNLENRRHFYMQWKSRYSAMYADKRAIERHIAFLADDLFW